MIEIELKGGLLTRIDEIDSDLARFNWFRLEKDGNVYAKRNLTREGKPYTSQMHREILERTLGRPLDKGEVCDHINHNGLDNRRENLRVASTSENSCNRLKTKANTSGYKGVTWRKDISKWQAQITVHGKRMYLGSYVLIEDAARAYNQAALKYHGDFAQTNQIPQITGENHVSHQDPNC